jgi:hypothetical protein
VLGKHRDAWSSLVALLRDLHGFDEADPRMRRLERELAAKCAAIGKCLTAADCDEKTLRTQLSDFFDFLGLDAFRRMFPQYLQGTFIGERFRDLTGHVWKCYQAAGDWAQALADFAGDDTVPIITVHKSKGLEYHTVVFMGLEDSAMWNFASQSEEEKRGFFVAFSRAKKRVLFTFCDTRAKGSGKAVSQTRKGIGVLYDLLESAGVTPEAVA